jgi:hypothetical protein
MNLINALSGCKSHLASLGLVVLGIVLIATGQVATGVHSMLVGLAALGIHTAVVNNSGGTPSSHPLLDQLWELLTPVLNPPPPEQAPPPAPQTIHDLVKAIQQPQQPAKLPPAS